jgi:Domain of unknown function (DUF4390)
MHLALAVACTALGWLPAAQAQGVLLARAELTRREGAVLMSYDIRLSLPKAVENALIHGVPVYFNANATLFRQRWYWRDERVARVSRTWRVAYQPLTSTWRVSLGGLSQSHASLEEALVGLSRASQWRLAEAAQVDVDSRHYVEFSFRLDTSQLPGPMQIGLAGQGDWQLGIDHTLRLEGP